MTNENFGDEIPELAGQLEGALNAPDPSAIHAGLGQRQAARKRMMSAAGAFVLVAAIAGGALALTGNDTTTTTVTADEVEDDSGDSETRQSAVGAVADDSAPFGLTAPLFDDLELRVSSIEGEAISAAIVNVSNAPTHIAFHRAGGSYPSDTIEVLGPCRADAFTIGWVSTSESAFTIEEPTPINRFVTADGSSTCEAPAADWLFTEGQEISVSVVHFGANSNYTLSSMEGPGWSLIAEGKGSPSTTVEPAVATTPNQATVNIAECANNSWLMFDGDRWLAWDLPAAWEDKGKVDVTVSLDAPDYITLLAADAEGNSATFDLDKGQARRRPCLGFDLPPSPILLQPPIGRPSTTSTTAAPATTTTTAAPATPSAAPAIEETALLYSQISRASWESLDSQNYDVSFTRRNPQGDVAYELSVRDGELSRVLPQDSFSSQLETLVLSTEFFDRMDSLSIAEDPGYLSWELDGNSSPYPGEVPWVDTAGTIHHLSMYDFRMTSEYVPCETEWFVPDEPAADIPQAVAAKRQALLDAISACDFSMLAHLSTSPSPSTNRYPGLSGVFWDPEYLVQDGAIIDLWDLLHNEHSVEEHLYSVPQTDDGMVFVWTSDDPNVDFKVGLDSDGNWVKQ